MERIIIIGSGCAGWTAALYTARAKFAAARAHRRTAGGPAHTTSIVENFPGFPEGLDGYELMARMQKQAETLRRRASFGTVRSGGFFPNVLSHSRWTVKQIEALAVHSRHRCEPQTSRRTRRGFAGNQRRDVLRHVRRRAAGFPQPAARRGRRRAIPACEEALYLTRLGRSCISCIAVFVARVKNHGRTHAVESKIKPIGIRR